MAELPSAGARRERPPINDKTNIFNAMKQKILQIQDPSAR